MGLKTGDACFFTAGDPAKFYKFAGLARDEVGRELKLIDEGRFAFAWIVDFPFYEWNEDEKKIDFSHNPFSMPQGRSRSASRLPRGPARCDYLKLKAIQYDIVCNGYEIASGSVRNHRPDDDGRGVRALQALGREVVEERFGGLLSRIPVRRAAARRHGGRYRAHGDAAHGHQDRARRGLVPDEPAGQRSSDGRAQRRLAEAARASFDPRGRAGEEVRRQRPPRPSR